MTDPSVRTFHTTIDQKILHHSLRISILSIAGQNLINYRRLHSGKTQKYERIRIHQVTEPMRFGISGLISTTVSDKRKYFANAGKEGAGYGARGTLSHFGPMRMMQVFRCMA